MSGPVTFSDRALGYFVSHGIDPAVAAEVGVSERGDSLIFSCADAAGAFERVRPLGDGPAKVRQPRGRQLVCWWPDGRPGTATQVLVCEGESDALAALSAIRASRGIAGEILADVQVVAVPGASFPVARLVDELRQLGTQRAILGADADAAGEKFTAAAGHALRAAGIEAPRLPLPAGRDLADELAAHGPEWLASSLADLQAWEQERAAEPIDTAELLAAVEAFVSRFVVLPSDAAAAAIALYVAHTHAVDAAEATPYLNVGSPERQSGKTRLLEVLELLVRVPWRVAGASEAAVFRKLEQDRPTLLLDEVDAIFGSNDGRTEPLRAILNAGNRRGASVARIVGKQHEVRDFCVFGCKLLAGISTRKLPDTITDRSLSIQMQRRRDGERVERFRYRRARADAEPIRAHLETWAATAVEALRGAEPQLPDDLSDRQADGWEPLLAIADHAGVGWPARARDAAVKLSVPGEGEELGYGAQLLAAVKAAMDGKAAITTEDLLAAINADEELPFGGWNDGKGLDARGLAKLLKAYGVKPKSVRIGDRTPKGYSADDLRDPWARYLRPDGAQQPKQAQHASSPTAENPHENGHVAGVAGVAHLTGANSSVADAHPDKRQPTPEASHADTEDPETLLRRLTAKFPELAQ
jgi:Protein of unknown function (DUF3631)/Toprim-like